MEPLAIIDDEVITAEDFIRFLKFSNEFQDLMQRFIRSKVTVHAAKKSGIEISPEELQQGSDDIRRVMGLHRAKETIEWLERSGISVEAFEQFVTEHLYRKKLTDKLVTDERIENYFQLNTPKFDTVNIKHIVVEGKDKANELTALISDEPETFGNLARDYSLDDETRNIGGQLNGIRRGVLPLPIEDKVFNASEGEIMGPFKLDGSELYEIIQLTSKKPASLEDSVKDQIAHAIYDEWLIREMKDHRVEFPGGNP